MCGSIYIEGQFVSNTFDLAKALGVKPWDLIYKPTHPTIRYSYTFKKNNGTCFCPIDIEATALHYGYWLERNVHSYSFTHISRFSCVPPVDEMDYYPITIDLDQRRINHEPVEDGVNP